jgi:hypothetical protein
MSRANLRVLFRFVSLTILFFSFPVQGADEAGKDGLSFALNDRGLQRLAFQGHSFLVHSSDGALDCFARTPVFAKSGEARIGEAVLSRHLDAETATLTCTYPWGQVIARYAALGENRLDITLTVSNGTDTVMEKLMLQAARLNYPQIPKVSSVGQDPSLFTGGNFGAAQSGQRPPAVLVDYGTAVLLVAGDRHCDEFTAGVFFAENGGLINRAGIGLTAIKPGEAKTAVLSLRWGPSGSTLRSLGGDILDGYVKANPATLDWPDRRPIGKIFLASNGNGPDQPRTNPNRWFMNAKDTDISTDAGKEAFRVKLLKYADGAIAALKHQDAQGGITWDPEGQRTGHTYYGDPRIIQWIAPEMEYRGTQELATVDAYFKKYTDAGLRHGLCVRPQRVRPSGDYWIQDELATAEERLAELDAKIGYAVKRWGSTLIYIDSDYAVSARDYAELHRRFPSVLLIPEWEQPLHYAYAAPLQSLFHHGVTGVPESIRELYPKSFIVNMMDNLPQAEEPVRRKIREAVRSGDVPMVNSWYIHEGTEAVRALYRDEAK